ncbi:MAG TPA: S41 family peptidase [Bacteroidia bacterium]|nr:S41 family peptidase [Bacteroidia bacterium]
MPASQERSTFTRVLIRRLCLVTAMAGIILTSGGKAQTVNTQPFLDKKATKILVDTLAWQLRKYYVFKDAATRMGAYIQKRCKEGYYNTISDPHVLAGQLTKDVSSVHLDEHFHVEYNPEAARELAGEIEDVPRFVEDKLNKEREKNFGFKKVEILNGNIAYLEISTFSRLNAYSKKTADAALELISNSSALIIDLRYGTGGSLDMVNHIMSKFFSTRTHITDIYLRSENDTLHYWTQPDSMPGRLCQIPVYILTSYKTFSAAEALTYGLQSLKRATVVGEVTRGGAHTVKYRNLSSGFISDIPFGVARSPVTKTNWEKIGITPDVMVNEENAPETAEKLIFENAFLKCQDSLMKKKLRWEYDLLESNNHPYPMDTAMLRKFSGNYGPYTVYFKENCLYYQKVGKAVFPLMPLNANTMKVKGNDSFRIEFIAGNNGLYTSIITHYDDGRKEVARRSP